jgi:hypothetical protein
MHETTLGVSYGITPWLAAEGRFSLRIADVSPTYSELDGTVKLVPNDIHHHDETLVGPSDPWLSLRASAAAGDFVTTARFGVTLPIGRTEPDPYALGAEGKWHEHIQFGTGTFIPIVGAGASVTLDPVEISVSALGLFSLYENDHGFRAPSRFFFSARGAVSLMEGAVRPYLTVDLPHETEELWNGVPGLEGSNVRTDLMAGAGVAWRFINPWQVELGFRGRVAKLTDAASFDYPGIVELAISTHFDTAGKAPP